MHDSPHPRDVASSLDSGIEANVPERVTRQRPTAGLLISESLADDEILAHWRDILQASGDAGWVRPLPERTQLGLDEITEELRSAGFDELRVEGEGAFGVVFCAKTRLHPRVAVKVLMREPAEREAYVPARIQSDYVVRVINTDQLAALKLPYIVMEYIDGRTLQRILLDDAEMDHATAARLTFEAALGLQAVHLAGFVHRDVKPSNILVESATGRVKIVDFGLATPHTQSHELATHSRHAAGTLQYMSPERLDPAVKVQPCADIYSLGVVLYQLLTGELPFRGDAAATLHQILNHEPAPPRQLVPTLERDLETICLKCLEKDPASRYASAQDMADDLSGYLKGEPIAARPISPLARGLRWCRRNKVITTWATTAILLLLTLTIGSSLFSIVLRMAWHTEASARADAESALRREAQQRHSAETNGARARQAINQFLLRMSQDPRLKSQPLEPLRKSLLEDARGFLTQFVSEETETSELRIEQAQAVQLLAEITGEIESYEKAVELHRQALDILCTLDWRQNDRIRESLADSHAQLADCYTKCDLVDQAEKHYRQAIELFNDLAARDATPTSRSNLAQITSSLGNLLCRLGKPDAAESPFRDSLTAFQKLHQSNSESPSTSLHLATAHRLLGAVLRDLNRLRESGEHLASALQIVNQLVKTPPSSDPANDDELVQVHLELGQLDHRRGELVSSVGHFSQTVEISRQLADSHPEVFGYRERQAIGDHLLATVLRDKGELATALQAIQNALAIRKQLALGQANIPKFQAAVIDSLGLLAAIRFDSGELQDARASYQESVEIAKQLAEQFPRVPDYLDRYATKLYELGVHLESTHEWPTAETTLRAARQEFGKLANANASVSMYRRNLARSTFALANGLKEQGRLSEAETHYGEALSTWEALSRVDTSPRSLEDTGDACLNLGVMHYMRFEFDQAGAMFGRALSSFSQLSKQFTDVYTFQQSEALAFDKIGSLHRKQGQLPAALESFEAGISVYRRLVERVSEIPACRYDLASSLNNAGAVLIESGRIPEGQRYLDEAQTLQQWLVEHCPRVLEYRVSLAMGFSNLAAVHSKLNEGEKSEQLFRATIDERRKLVAEFPQSPMLNRDLVLSYNNLGFIHVSQKRFADALKLFDAALPLAKQLPDVPLFQEDHARTWIGMAIVLAKSQRWDESGRAFVEATGILDGVAAEHSDIPGLRHKAAEAYEEWYTALYDGGRFQQAIEPIQKALASWQRLSAEHPQEARYQQKLASTFTALGTVSLQTNRLREGEEALQQSVAVLQKLPSSLQVGRSLANAYNNLAGVYAPTGRFTEAESSLRQALELREKLADENAGDVGLQKSVADSYYNLAVLYRDHQKWTEAEKYIRPAITRRQQLADRSSTDISSLESLAVAHLTLGDILLHQETAERYEEAIASYDESERIRSRILADQPQLAAVAIGLVWSHLRKAQIEQRRKQSDAALSEARTAVSLAEKLLDQAPQFTPIQSLYPSVLLLEAEFLEAAGSYPEAGALLRRGLDHVQGPPNLDLRLRLARVLTRADKYESGVDLAKSVGSTKAKPDRLIDLARVYSLAIRSVSQRTETSTATREQLQQQYTREALQYLRRAQAVGHFQDANIRNQLRSDPDFSLLSEQPEFQQLFDESPKREAERDTSGNLIAPASKNDH